MFFSIIATTDRTEFENDLPNIMIKQNIPNPLQSTNLFQSSVCILNWVNVSSEFGKLLNPQNLQSFA